MPTTILDNESYLEALQRRYVEESKNEENMKLIQMAEEACSPNQTFNSDEEWVKRFAAIVAAHEAEKWKAANKRDYENWKMAAEKAAECEREAIAQMFDDPPKLISSAQNNEGGCLICGFTPKIAAAAIRARGEK